METKLCPKCSANRVKQYTGMVLCDNPPQYPFIWYCGCGYNEETGVDRHQYEPPTIHEIWQKANPDKPADKHPEYGVSRISDREYKEAQRAKNVGITKLTEELALNPKAAVSPYTMTDTCGVVDKPPTTKPSAWMDANHNIHSHGPEEKPDWCPLCSAKTEGE